MAYEFDNLPNRAGTKSLKWEVGEGELAMWVADMDFAVAPEIYEALKTRLEERVYGYSVLDEQWENAYTSWWKKRHNYEIKKGSLTYAGGTLAAINSLIRKLSAPGENVVILTPVYNCFFYCIKNMGRNTLSCELRYEEGEYFIDWGNLEFCLKDPQTSLLLLCNPHNPIGRTLRKDELMRIGELCEKYGVIVISDEVHCDITEPGVNYTPFAAASEVCANLSANIIAPTKAFNIAGLQTAAVFTPNPKLHKKVSRALNGDDIAEPSFFGLIAAICAFERGEAWLEEMRAYVSANRKFVNEFIARELPKVRSVAQNATYLMWLDVSEYCDEGTKLANFIRQKTGLFLSHGAQYGKGGEKFLRLNIATSRKNVIDGLSRLKTALDLWEGQI
ncbi:pyridoxal phosphate-dependent aminotransferase [Campylobacter sp. JMF_02 ED1]|uniref:MalY/PatB family protein n=1 Tax=unclassified Campylobacter TaxID=2593542 RepID=UPI0022E9C2EC|nr:MULTISPECIES: MalY/PatB family protein [unclassified Campylobacter]MDA3050020.1 pyridoxal phosphate-dependent aminotransferase [Campylobacter sp. JMF_15 NE4]MDA3050978.1 pyridoxal phosphate-dependent aminotransferase [Campylobacter sp. JMF_02 ED1]